MVCSKCSCGRNLPLISKIVGRSSDLIVTPSGRILTRPSFFGAPNIKLIKGLINYQVIQERKDKVTINIVINENFIDDSRFNNWTFKSCK